MGNRPTIGITYSVAEFPAQLHWRTMLSALPAVNAVALPVETGYGPVDVGSYVDLLDGLIIGGGGDVNPALYGGHTDDPTLWGVNDTRDANEALAIRAAVRKGIPVLAICRGLHLYTALYGGTLWQDLPRDRPSDIIHNPGEKFLDTATHTVTLRPDAVLARWIGQTTIEVNSEHHQAIRTLGRGSTRVATSGDGLTEAVVGHDGLVTGIQWHPEVSWPGDDHARHLLHAFTESCR